MSIRECIFDWLQSGELVHLEPALAAVPTRRHVFATSEVCNFLNGPWPDARSERQWGRARAYVDTFISGDLISVRMPPSKSVRAHTALLEDRKNEVWEIRARDPKPGVRLFGRFSEKDTFIALTAECRENIRDDSDWSAEIERCKKAWRWYFPTFPPFSGNDANDYLSNIFPV